MKMHKVCLVQERNIRMIVVVGLAAMERKRVRRKKGIKLKVRLWAMKGKASHKYKLELECSKIRMKQVVDSKNRIESIHLE